MISPIGRTPALQNKRNPVAAPLAPIQTAPTTSDSRIKAAPSHHDGTLRASDGKSLAYRTTEPAAAPKAIVVMQQGTLGKPEYFDLMGSRLAGSGIKSYALGARSEAPDYRQHAADLEALVQLARKENPGVPVTVMGVSLGAMIALDWSARHNDERIPVVAMSPVVPPFSRYLSIKDSATIAAGLASDRAADRHVNTPMSAGIRLTTNPDSPEAHLPNAKAMTVPARLFGDVVKMTAEVSAKGRRMTGPLFIAMAGADEVAVNSATHGFAKLIRSQDKTVRTFPGLAHDLSQETHRPELPDALASWILRQK